MTAAELTAHFLQWSGGFAPDSPEQITFYMDYARDADTGEEYVRRVLTAWLEEQTSASSARKARDPTRCVAGRTTEPYSP